jgi:hypothetical protein
MAVIRSLLLAVVVVALTSAPVGADGGAAVVLTPDQMLEMFDGAELDGVRTRSLYPWITGNIAADEQIYELAERQGYKLRGGYGGPRVEVAGVPLHPAAAAAFEGLMAAAQLDGVTLTPNFGLRTVDHQRLLFRARLHASAERIAAGDADATVIATMELVAPPGFSKHHTGYTIDLSTSDGYRWLTQDNYINVKDFGWLPSYPTGATSEYGPNPEIWEFVYVGVETIQCQLSCVLAPPPTPSRPTQGSTAMFGGVPPYVRVILGLD